MQVGLHELKHEVDVAVVMRPQHVLQAHDVVVAAELLQEDDLAERALFARLCLCLC